MTVAHDVMDENDVADAILKNSSDQISEGTALYLDGELTAVCADGNSLQRYISSLLEPYENPDDPNTTVGFNKDVTLENGIYFNESFQEEAEVEQLLSGVQQAEKSYTVQSGDTIWSIAQKNGLTVKELCEMNTGFTANGENGLTQNSKILPGDALTVVREEETLEVRITKVESWEEEIAYTTETTKSKELNSGTKRVTQKGENGIRTVTAQRVYDANGNQLSQQILSTVVTKEPVTEKVTVGTKKVSSGASYITGSGRFIWPVPGYRNCSRWYGGSHKGVDICAAAGTPIYASAGGTVTKPAITAPVRVQATATPSSSATATATPPCTPTACRWWCTPVSRSSRVSSSAMWAAPDVPAATTATSRSGANGSYIAPQNVFNRSKYR